MMDEINVDTNNSIKFAQTSPFDKVAVPQTNFSQMLDAAALNTPPKPVNIKIKVKNKEEIARVLGVTLPNFSTPGPKKVRLVSSDQTIISFDLFMETENEKKIPKKTHHKFFELFKPSGCFNNQSDDDVYPYVPSSSNETYRAKSASQVNDLQEKICEDKFALKKNLEPMMSTNTLKTPTFLGKCKPGGCLDPPFSEDKYIYKPNTFAIDQKFTEKQDLDETNNKNTKNTAKDVDKVDISSQDSRNKSSFEKNCSRSLITYPPALSSSSIRDQEEIPSKKSKLRSSTENNARMSINEFSDIYYMPPKQQKSKNNEKLNAEVSENLNMRCESYDTYSLTNQKERQKEERISSSKNELYNQATELNVVNPHIKERCEKNSEFFFLDDNYIATVREIVKIQTLEVSSISDVSDISLDIINEDIVEKKKNSLANLQTNIEDADICEAETKIDTNVFEINLDSSPITKSSLIFKNKMTPENFPTVAKDFRISKLERNSNEVLCDLKPVPDKSVDNQQLASQEQNKFKLPTENQSLRSYRLYNSDETKIKFEPLIPPDEIILTSSQTGVIKLSSNRPLQNKKSDHSSVQEQQKIQETEYKESVQSFIIDEIQDRECKESDLLSVKEKTQYEKSNHSRTKEQILVREHKELEHLSLKEQILTRENKENYDSSLKEQTREQKEPDLLSVKEQIQDRKHDYFDSPSLKDHIKYKEYKEYKESDHSSMIKQTQDRKQDEFDYSSIKEQIQVKEDKKSDRSSLEEQTLVREGKEFDLSSVKEQTQDRKNDIFDTSSEKEQLQDRQHKISHRSSLKEQMQDGELKESDYIIIEEIQEREHKGSDLSSVNEQTQYRKQEELDHSTKGQIQLKGDKELEHSSVKEQIQARENKENDHSSLKEQTLVREDKESDHSSVKEQTQDRKYKAFDHTSVKEPIQDRESKVSDHSSLKEQIKYRECKESDHSLIIKQTQDRKHEEFDYSSIKQQIQVKEDKKSEHSFLTEQTLVREGKEFDLSFVKEQTQDEKNDIFDSSSEKEQLQDRQHKISDCSSLKEQIYDREYKDCDYSSIIDEIQERKHKGSDLSSVKEQTKYRKQEELDHSTKGQIQLKEDKELEHSSVKNKEQARENKENVHSSLKEQTQVREDKESDLSSVKEQIQDTKYNNFESSSLKGQTQDRKYKEFDHTSIKEPIRNREYKVSDHSSFKEQIQYKQYKASDYSSRKERVQDIEIADVNQKELQQNRLLQDEENELRDKNTLQDFTALMLNEAAEELIVDQKSNNGMSSKTSPFFQEKISSTPQTQKEDNNDLIYYANKISLASSQIMDVTPTLKSTSTSSTLPTQKKDTVGNEPVGYENTNSLATRQIIKPTSSLKLTTAVSFPDKTNSILQTQEKHASDKHPEYYENKINLETIQIHKLPINVSDRTTTPMDNLKIQKSDDDDDDQGLSGIVPIKAQSIKINDIKSGDKHYIEMKPQFQTSKNKITSMPANYEMARYGSSDISASFNKKVEDQPQMVSKEYPVIYRKSSNMNNLESYPASSKKTVVKNFNINVMKAETENIIKKNSLIKINLGFHTYVNDENETVITSFDTSDHLKKDTRAKVTVIKSIVRKNDSEIRIPVNSEIDLTLQIKKILDIDDTKKESTKKVSKKSDKADKDILLQETVLSVYENLVPVENIIRNLKQEAGFLTQQQVLLREMLNTMKTTSMKIINTNNKTCTCNRYYM